VNAKRTAVRRARRAFLSPDSSDAERTLALSDLLHALDDPSPWIRLEVARAFVAADDPEKIRRVSQDERHSGALTGRRVSEPAT